MARVAEDFGRFYQMVSEDIFLFCRLMNFVPTWQQVQLLRAVQAKARRIAVKSGQGPGKTTCSAIVGLYQLFRKPDSLLVVTAPSMRQCRDVWLAEARLVLSRAMPELSQFFKVTKTKIEVAEQPGWSCKLVTATKAENAQGYHNENMSVIMEEASGIPDEIITQFKGTLSNPEALLLQIGNPTVRSGAFFNAFTTDRGNWHRLTWNAEETPESKWFSKARNKALEEEFGRDSDVYRIRVLGEFPHADPNCVISSEELEHVMGLSPVEVIRMARMERDEAFGGGIAKQFGLDFARYGSDESTVFRRAGNAIMDWETFNHTDPSVACDKAFDMQRKAAWGNAETIYVADAGGMGQGIMHRFAEKHKHVVEFHNNGRPSDKQYENRITEGFFHLARLVRAKKCSLPLDTRLITQLTGRQYYTNKKNKLVLESKDEYMKRGFDSPDRADGLVLAFTDALQTQTQTARGTIMPQRTGIGLRGIQGIAG